MQEVVKKNDKNSKKISECL